MPESTGAPLKRRATQHFYDSNLNPRQVTRGQIFLVNDEVQARDYAHLSEPYDGDEEPTAEVGTPPGTVTRLERKQRETPLNKANPAPENKAS